MQGFCGDTQERVNVTQVSIKGIISHPFHPLPGTEFKAHSTAKDVKRILGDEIWDDYFVFANVRNPFDAVVSAFFDQKPYFSDGLTFEDWWFNYFNRQDFIWNVIQVDGHSGLDDVVRYESLEVDLQRICERLNIDFTASEFPRLRTTERPMQGDTKILYQDVLRANYLIKEVSDVFKYTVNEYSYEYERK